MQEAVRSDGRRTCAGKNEQKDNAECFLHDAIFENAGRTFASRALVSSATKRS